MLNETIESRKEEICRVHQGDERGRRDQQLPHEKWLKQNWDLREAHEKSLSEMKELRRFQSFTFDTIFELIGKIQGSQSEVNCMNDSRDFQDAASVRSGQSYVASQFVFFPLHPVSGGMLSRSIGMQSRRERPPSIWGHTWFFGKGFCKSSSVFFSTLSSRIASMKFIDRRVAPFTHTGEK